MKKIPLAIGIIILMLAYVGVFVTNKNTGLSLNGYDLAEWLTLLPSERTNTIPLLTAFLVRIHLPILLVCLMTIRSKMPKIERFILLFFAGALVIAQLPPAEFIVNSTDANYRQQLFLAVFSLIIIAIYLFTDYTKYIIHVALLVGIAAWLYTIPKSLNLMSDYRLQSNIGMGAIVLILTYAVGILYVFWQQKRDSEMLSLLSNQLSKNT